MKKLLFSTTVLLTLLSSSLFANINKKDAINQNERVAYKYATFGVGPVIFIPQVGMGYRTHGIRHGWDSSLSLSSIILVHYLTGSINYHYYFQRNIENPMYAGIGVNGGIVALNDLKNNLFTVSPNFIIGKEFANGNKKTFLEANVAAPVWNAHRIRLKDRLNLPLVSIKYGISF